MNILHVRIAFPSRRALFFSVFVATMIAVTLATTPYVFALGLVPSNTLTSSLNPSTYGQAVTFTATFYGNAAPSASTNNCSVGFYDGATFMGCGATQGNDGSLVSQFTTSSLTVGTHIIGATINVSSANRVLSPSNGNTVYLTQVVKDPAEVPEADTVLLFGGGIGGLATWLRFQWNKRRKAS